MSDGGFVHRASRPGPLEAGDRRHYPRDGSCEICGRSTAQLAADARARADAVKHG